MHTASTPTTSGERRADPDSLTGEKQCCLLRAGHVRSQMNSSIRDASSFVTRLCPAVLVPFVIASCMVHSSLDHLFDSDVVCEQMRDPHSLPPPHPLGVDGDEETMLVCFEVL